MTAAPPYLAGNYAPVTDELTTQELPVTGSIPAGLTGWYLRNGPNPRDAASGHWFAGDGMVHGVRLENGRAISYRNRWVRTRSFTGEVKAPDAHGRRDLTASVANTHVVRHAGRTLALVESSFPYELTCDLDTVGPFDFDGRLRTPMTAHPKTCPDTGELHFFGYGGPQPPYLTYHRADAAGNLTISRPVEVPALTMMHDFSLTTGHVIFMDLPVVFDLDTARHGVAMPFRWDEGYGARLGVLRRDEPYGQIRWFPIDPCYVFHTLNAHDQSGPSGQDQIVMYVCRYPQMWDGGPGGRVPGVLWRWIIDLAAGTVAEEQVDDRHCEFPRIDDRLAGAACGFGHVASAHAPGGEQIAGALIRYDLASGAPVVHQFGPGRYPGEAAFAPADGRPGGAGWLITFVYDEARDSSDLVILDAGDLAAQPRATVALPRRVPFGFHGNWLPDPA
jgi:carotenoid cleavage dioxygenase-like enzyme